VVPVGSIVLILAAVSSTTFLILERMVLITLSFAADLVTAFFFTAGLPFAMLVFFEPVFFLAVFFFVVIFFFIEIASFGHACLTIIKLSEK
jgi:hypothetical protein